MSRPSPRSNFLLLGWLCLTLFLARAQGNRLDETSVNSTVRSEQSSCSATDDTCLAGGARAIATDHVTTDEAIDDVPTGCVDLSEECKELVEYGECETHPTYMEENCAKSCQLCFE